MGIADFFRPKYRNSDVKVRLEAVRALSSEDNDILASIARTDREASVRRVAIEKLDEADVLAAIASEESDRALRDLAGARAAALWVTVACGDDGDAATGALEGLVRLGDQRALAEVASRASRPEMRVAALTRIDEPRALAEVAKTTSQPALRSQALGKIVDADVLGAIAVDTTNKELGLGAVDRLDEEDVLERVAQKAKNKAVRQRARRKLEEAADRRRDESPRVSDAVKRRRAEQAQLLREIDALHDTHEWERSLVTVERIASEWKRLGGADDPAVEDRFQKAFTRYHERRDAVIELQEKQRAAMPRPEPHPEPRPEPRPEPKAEARPEPQPESKPEPKPEPAARPVVEDRSPQIIASLDALLGEMQAMLESTDGRAIDRLLGQAAKAFEQTTKLAGDARRALEDRYQQGRAQLVIRIQELREAEDWQRWANVPRAEALIKEAVALLELEAPRIEQLKELQGRWKALGAMPRKKSQELWEQFKATTDQVFAKFQTARSVEKEKSAASIALKEQLIAEAEALAESTDWETTAEKLKELQKRWKESGHVPRKQGDALWKKFRAACDRFFERRKPLLEEKHADQERNLEEKRALIERVDAVVAAAPGDGGWGASIRQVRELQDRWKEIGHVPRKDADEINKRFRAACDALFAKRDAERDAIAAEIDEVSRSEDPGAVARAIELRHKAAPQLADRIDAMLRAVIARHPGAVAGTEIDPAAFRARREKLLAKAEELVPKQRPGIDPSLPPEQLAAALKTAMAERALGDFRGAGDPRAAVEDLRAQWAEVGPDVDEELSRRFRDACDRILGREPGTAARSGTGTGTGPAAAPAAAAAAASAPAAAPESAPAAAAAAESAAAAAAEAAAEAAAAAETAAETATDPVAVAEADVEAAEAPDADAVAEPAVDEARGPEMPGAAAGDASTEGDVDAGWD